MFVIVLQQLLHLYEKRRRPLKICPVRLHNITFLLPGDLPDPLCRQNVPLSYRFIFFLQQIPIIQFQVSFLYFSYFCQHALIPVTPVQDICSCVSSPFLDPDQIHAAPQ